MNNMTLLPYHGRLSTFLRQNSTKTMITRSQTQFNTIFYELPYTGRLLSTYKKQNKKPCIINKINRTYSTGLFYKLLSLQGQKFEKMVVEDLETRTGIKIPSISTKVSTTSIDKTLKYMKEGYKIIHSVPLSYNGENGIADFIVRSDCMHLFFNTSYISCQHQHLPCSISNNYHYVVVEVKYTTLALKKDGVHLQNVGDQKYIKAQVFRYNQLLGYMQGYTPNTAFIIGRRYKFTEKNNNHLESIYYNRLGVVDFTIEENIFIKNFVKQCNTLQPKIDITKVWKCSNKHANILRKHHICSFMNQKCTATALGFSGFQGFVVDCILQTQRQNEHLILPEYMPLDIIPERTDKDYFIDFEVIPEVLSDSLNSPMCNRKMYVFLIGIGCIKDGKWTYNSLIMEELNCTSQRKILKQFLDIIPGDANLYHWGHAEPSFWKNVSKFSQLHTNLNWIDLSKIFTDTPITLKGCLNFKLKDIAHAMHEHGMIHTKWIANMDGLECGAQALQKYNNKEQEFNDIIEYNEVDCKVLMEILCYLQSRYTDDAFLP